MFHFENQTKQIGFYSFFKLQNGTLRGVCVVIVRHGLLGDVRDKRRQIRRRADKQCGYVGGYGQCADRRGTYASGDRRAERGTHFDQSAETKRIPDGSGDRGGIAAGRTQNQNHIQFCNNFDRS